MDTQRLIKENEYLRSQIISLKKQIKNQLKEIKHLKKENRLPFDDNLPPNYHVIEDL